MMVMIKDEDLFYVGTEDLVIADILLRLGKAVEDQDITVDQLEALIKPDTSASSYAGLCNLIMQLMVEYTGVTSEVILADDGIEVEAAETLVDLQLAERLEHGQYRVLWKNLEGLSDQGVWTGLGGDRGESTL